MMYRTLLSTDEPQSNDECSAVTRHHPISYRCSAAIHVVNCIQFFAVQSQFVNDSPVVTDLELQRYTLSRTGGHRSRNPLPSVYEAPIRTREYAPRLSRE